MILQETPGSVYVPWWWRVESEMSLIRRCCVHSGNTHSDVVLLDHQSGNDCQESYESFRAVNAHVPLI